MNKNTGSTAITQSEFKRVSKFILNELKPKGKLLTPFNIFSSAIILLAAFLLIIRFTKGLGAVTNLSQDYPWGIWIGFDVITGVAFAGGAYIVTFMVYILGQHKYHPIVRVTVLNGFLAYLFYAGALLLDLGKPWNVINPIIGNSFGLSSVMFLVAWHFLLYIIMELIEFFPAIAEWLGWKRVRRVVGVMTIGAVILGFTLSSLHQAGLGALFLMAKSKIHPLWYSEFIPIYFFVSSIFAGLSLVIFEGSISHKIFKDKLTPELHANYNSIVIGLAKICSGTMFVYLFLKILSIFHGQHLADLATSWGLWFLLEVIGFVLFPCILFLVGAKQQNMIIIRVASVLTLVGIILNRLNVSLIAYRWFDAVRYVPSWMEIEITMAVILAEVIVFRWVINRMPVLSPSPKWAETEEDHKEEKSSINAEELIEWKVSPM
jgi:Ni/Fe-hydrogenase subunit HybB-like protein